MRAALAVCCIVPLAIIAAKLPGSPLAAQAWTWCSLVWLPNSERPLMEDVLAVPVAALVVAAARLVFGVRVLSMFRPILLALALRSAGIVPGLLLVAAVLGFIVALRPVWGREPYYARVAFVLPLAALPLVAAQAGAHALGVSWLRALGVFPVIALGLTCEGFVRVLGRDGIAGAARQMAATVAVALFIVMVFAAYPLLPLLLRYPELLVADAGLVLVLTRAVAAGAERRPQAALTPMGGVS